VGAFQRFPAILQQAKKLSAGSLAYGFALAAPLGAVALTAVSPLGTIALLFIADMLLLYPTLQPRCQWFGPVTSRFPTSRREVWLTIDDGPDPRDTLLLLDILRRYQARATFFVVGEKARRHRAMARAMLAGGHELGNHSHRHPSASFWLLGSESLEREIVLANEAIAELAGHPVGLFRAPVGMKNRAIHGILQRHGMRLIAWSARGFDGIRPCPRKVVARIMARVQPGAIILLHQGRFDAHGNSLSAACLERLLEHLGREGYHCVLPALPPPRGRAEWP
jgi:peptidoglycan/xylan/chitin deacetylase (PgdA/CDA1 family)